ncbi:MAG: ABC transporter permease [Chthoniobacter sp.]|nr:ABC transporter permease [Chthoniobacter sp.]
MIFVLLFVVTITFGLTLMMPSPLTREKAMTPETRKRMEAKYNLDGTVWEQFTRYIGVRRMSSGEYTGLLQGNFQPSTKYADRSVNELLGNTLPISAIVGFAAFLIATAGGIWLGSLAAVRHHTPVDTGAMLAALFLISIPTFVVGPVLVLIFAIRLGWLPVGGWTSWASLILPAITLAGPYVAYIARLIRTSMLEVLGQDFIRTARAKGMTDTRVIYKHALKVAILPVVSYLGPLAANLLTGSLVVETIFNLPGAGPFFINSVLNSDRSLLLGVVIVYCTVLVVLNLAVDIAYTFLDRRIALSS